MGRSALYVLGLALRRLRRGTGTTALIVLGVAAGAAVVFGIRAGTTVAQDRAVAQAVERLPDGSRSVRAVWFGVPGQSPLPQPRLDDLARDALAQAGAPAPVGLVLYRETTIAGSFAGLGGVEGLARFVALRSGRLPRTCTPARCEVLRLRGAGRLPDPAGLRLVEVGEAALRSRLLFGDFLAPTDNALEDAQVSPSLAAAAGYHRPPPAPLFLAEGVRTLATAPDLERLYRSYAWVSPLRAGVPRLWEIDALAAGVARARSELQGVTTQFDLIAPVQELRAAQAESERAGHRLALVGGEAAALLFAFAILAAMTVRRDAAAARRRLAWAGARAWQLALLTGVETGALALAGTVLGVLAGIGAGALVAARAGAPVTDVLRQSVLAPGGVVLGIAVAVGAGLVLFGSVVSRPARFRGFSPLDALALGAAVLALVAIRAGDSELTLLLPALVAFAAAVAVARLLRPALRGLERVTRGRSLGLRLASLSLARNPGYAIVATAFLVVSFGLALAAESYRATLGQGERDQAAFAVPRDYLLREDLTRLIPLQDASPLGRAPGDADPVLRLTGSIGRLEGETGITLLGLPPATLPLLHGWRDSFAAKPRAELARALEAEGGLDGLALPAALVVTAPTPVKLAAQVALPRGRFGRVELGVVSGTRRLELNGGTLVGLELKAATKLQERGADAGRAEQGTLSVAVEGQPGALAGWVGVGGATLAGNSVAYTLSPEEATRIRPRVPSDREPVPVLATTRLAAAAGANGLLPLQVGGERVAVRVVATVERFPGVLGQAVVGDVDALLSLLNAARPGAARVNELWIGGTGPALEHALASPPYDVLEVESRQAVAADARRDPIAHGTLLALVAAALVALLLALAGILLTVLGDLRDERGELFDLEAEGASPGLLRGLIRIRAGIVAVAGLAAGAATGLVLAGGSTDLVALTARATAPEPPLRLAVDPWVVGGAIAAYALAASAPGGARDPPRVPARPGAAPGGGDRMSAVVDVRDLFRVHASPEGGVAALQGLTLRVEEGEICVVLGPSGSGKSTLVRIVAGFDRPSAGSVRVAGVDVASLSGAAAARFRSRTLGYADQHYWRALAGELSARELVGVQLGLAGSGREERRRRATELLDRVGLGDRLDAHPRELSGGEQQRVALCAALAHRPRLLVADEPTGDLDAVSARGVLDLIAELVRAEGGTALLVTHNPASAEVADRVVQVRDGRVSDERLEGEASDAVVVGRGGWLRVPEDVLRAAGIGSRATVRLSGRDVIVAATEACVDATQAPLPSRNEAVPAPLSVVATQSPPASRALVVARGLRRSFGEATPIDGLSLDLHGGRLYAVTGPSGSGKTTLLHLLAGLDLPDEGEVVVDGISLAGLDRAGRSELRRRAIAFVGQTVGLVPFLGARENAELSLALRGLEDADGRVAKALAAVGLDEHAERPVSELSAGQRERAALARALASRPLALIADEPTARLDGASALAVGALLAGLARTTGAVVVCATHDPLLIEQADELVRLG